MLWVDAYRPSQLQDLSYHSDITQRLGRLAERKATLPHLLVYGPSGSGKKTRVTALLHALYGPSAAKIRLDKRTFTTPTKRQIEIHMITSNYHIELSPGDAGLNDRFVIQEVIKEMASNKNVVSATADGGGKAASAKAPFKTVVLTEVDRLSRQAQAALRRTMEKYTSTCRLILVCNSQSKVIEPVRSRCLGIRVGAPTHDEVCMYRYAHTMLRCCYRVGCFLRSCELCDSSVLLLSFSTCHASRFVPSSRRSRTNKPLRFLTSSPLILHENPPATYVAQFSCWKLVTCRNGMG